VIEIDPTESRENTRLPSSSSYHQAGGLESFTGADILVHPYGKLPDKLLKIPPQLRALQRCIEGGFLIQRKSGSDFLSSIVDLAEIEHRMLRWSGNPWLLITGIKRTAKGSVSVKSSHHSFRNWKWNSIQAAMDSWSLRGGSVTLLDDDKMITDWLLWCEKTCTDWLKNPSRVVVHKTASQSISEQDPNWVNTGRAWPPGIGEKLLINLARYVRKRWGLPDTLANCISLACSDEITNVPLWGRKRQLDMRRWWGVNVSIIPTHLGVKSSAWLYHQEKVSGEKDRRIELIERVLGDEIVSVDGKVYTTESLCLGTVEDPMRIPGGGFIMDEGRK